MSLVGSQSLVSCADQPQSLGCIQTMIFFTINCVLLIWTSIWLFLRYLDQGLQQPGVKTMILSCMWMSIGSLMMFEIDMKLHWAYYQYILFDYVYFIWILYYFGRKALKLMEQQKHLLKYQIMTGIMLFLFFLNFVANNLKDQHDTRNLCNQRWYTYARAVGLLMQLGFCITSSVIYYRLDKRLIELSHTSLNPRHTNYLASRRRQMNILIILVLVFLVAQLTLLGQTLSFQLNPNNSCQFSPSDPALDFTLNFIVELLGNYSPKIITIMVFKRHNQQEELEQDTQSDKMQMMLLRTVSAIKSTTSKSSD